MHCKLGENVPVLKKGKEREIKKSVAGNSSVRLCFGAHVWFLCYSGTNPGLRLAGL